MSSIDEREKNLFNATDALAQFYGEIENFHGILFDCMEREGYGQRGVRLRSGTLTGKNLPRRLLASMSAIYIKGSDDSEEIEDEEEEEEKSDTKAMVPISPDLKIPFAVVWLFAPKSVPSVRNLASPYLIIGALGQFSLLDNKSQQPITPLPKNAELGLSNLAQLSITQSGAIGKGISLRCRKPKDMRKYSLQGEFIAYERLRLLEIDSQEKIGAVADKLVGFCSG